MSKNVLGRGLGELLPERKPKAREASAEGKSKDPAVLGPGLRVLVLKKNGAAPRPIVPVAPSAAAAAARVKISLLLADLLLVAIVLLWCNNAARPFHWLEVLICIVAVTFGAWLTCLAAWLQFRRDM